MTVRTISQLPEETSLNGIKLSSFVEVSVPTDSNLTSFISRKTSFKNMNDTVLNNLSTEMIDQFALTRDGENIKLSSEVGRIDRLYSGDTAIGGYKKFEKFPQVKLTELPEDLQPYGYDKKNIIPNVGIVQQLVEENPVFVSSTQSMVADGCPFTDANGSPLVNKVQINYNMTVGRGDERFYFWKIDDNGTDSSETNYDQMSLTKDAYEKVRGTGRMVIWGWLADRGEVPAECAWVGLFTRMKYQGENNTMIEVPLQIKPWIRGNFASTLQYVGFDVSVRQGTELKIKTGFRVQGGNTGAWQHNDSTLTFKDEWIPNAFFGYLIKNM